MSEVDEALEDTRRVTHGFTTSGEYPWEMARILGAEVERLRAVNDALKSKSVLGTAYASALEDLEATRKQLAWFEAWEQKITQAYCRLRNIDESYSELSAVEELETWERANPKPEGGA